jgi:hypothetical protein
MDVQITFSDFQMITKLIFLKDEIDVCVCENIQKTDDSKNTSRQRDSEQQ